MLIHLSKFVGLTVQASDGPLGVVSEVYFDDESWTIRYLIVDTGSWLSGRQVLISPYSAEQVDWQARLVHVRLTMQQVENSPGIDTDKPVSRQHEAAYLGYYGYPYYWGGPNLWGPEFYPTGVAVPAVQPSTVAVPEHAADSHLRSTNAVNGYAIEATDGEIGHVCGFVADDEAWTLRYIEMSTTNWWPGKKVLLSPTWVERVSWMESKVYVAVKRDVIEKGPDYHDSEPITRVYEEQLYLHFGRPPYWVSAPGEAGVR